MLELIKRNPPDWLLLAICVLAWVVAAASALAESKEQQTPAVSISAQEYMERDLDVINKAVEDFDKAVERQGVNLLDGNYRVELRLIRAK